MELPGTSDHRVVVRRTVAGRKKTDAGAARVIDDIVAGEAVLALIEGRVRTVLVKELGIGVKAEQDAAFLHPVNQVFFDDAILDAALHIHAGGADIVDIAVAHDHAVAVHVVNALGVGAAIGHGIGRADAAVVQFAGDDLDIVAGGLYLDAVPARVVDFAIAERDIAHALAGGFAPVPVGLEADAVVVAAL